MNSISKASGLIFGLWLLITSNICQAFQTYQGEDQKSQIDPAIKSFRYYISPTYWDLLSGREKPMTEFLAQSVHDSFSILKRDTAHVGLDFIYAGIKDVDTLKNSAEGEEFRGAIYIDFASRIFEFSTGAFAGVTLTRKLQANDAYLVGGIVHMNGKMLNWHHPLIENFSTIIHETLHIIGVGHSTNSSSIMAYTENWHPRLSVDDKRAVSTIYGASSDGSSPSVTATLNGVAAGGIEIVWIDKTTGASQITVTDAKGTAKVSGLPAGSYYLAARELTPTGPCFANPTRGFLTTYFAAVPTNQLSSAETIDLVDGGSPAYNLNLIAGTKKFDCHYIASIWCESSTDCARHRIKAGSSGRANVQNDLSATNHQTDTNVNSGAHSSIVLSSVGTSSPFTFGSSMLGDGTNAATVGYNLENHTVADLSVSESAAEGTYAALCSSNGEESLLSSAIEIMNDATWVTNQEMWPSYVSQMSDPGSPRNYSELLALEKPKTPKKVLGLACGTINSGSNYEDGAGRYYMVMMVLFPFLIHIVSKLKTSIFKATNILIVILTLLSLASENASALDVYAGAWLETESEKGESSTSRSKYRVSLAPTQAVYGQLSLGGKLVYETENKKHPTHTEVVTFAALGPSVGYTSSGPVSFTGLATYLLLPTRTTKGVSEVTEYGGTGLSLDFGIKGQFGNFALGPVLTYQSVTYKKETNSSLEQSIDATHTRLQCDLGFWWSI